MRKLQFLKKNGIDPLLAQVSARNWADKCNLCFNPKCPLEIYYEKITLHNCFSTQFCGINVAKATSAGQKFRASQLLCVVFSHSKSNGQFGFND